MSVSLAETYAPPRPHARAAQERDRLLMQVDERIREFLAAERSHWSSTDHRASVLIDALTKLIHAGGKRLRPAFCISGYLAAGGDAASRSVVTAASALEMLHACALIHDDVMDESAMRRGMATVHTRQADEHRRRGWLGSPSRFGESVAILAGDLALVYADRLMAQAPRTAEPEWAELRTELIVGQYLDVASAADTAIDPQLARWIAVMKSGRYTIHRPLTLGAILADRPDLAAAFETYGTLLGEAFQLRDDLLNAFGNPDVTGKPGGIDLEQQKMTLLLALAVQRAYPEPDAFQPDRLAPARLREMLTADVREEVEQHISELVRQACQALVAAPIEPEWRDELTEMAHRAAFRDK